MKDKNIQNEIQKLTLENEVLKKRLKEQEEELSEARDIKENTMKLAAMGDMLMSIVHQWRQPLNIISILASSLNLVKIIDEEEKKELDQSVQDIISNVIHLADTMELFTGFVKESNEITNVNIEKEIQKALGLTHHSMKNDDIKINLDINNIKGIEKNIIQGALVNILINILNNSRNVFQERNIKNPEILIEGKQENEKTIITITDNGGGLKLANLEKIFEPYYSTKNENKGLGLGLAMSKKLSKDALYGEITAQNLNNGAQFNIIF